ncbi:MAG: ATP synthase F1 subunit gamma [bacterium]|nr:ATP synthase F1 subunit gamma [bacterium]
MPSNRQLKAKLYTVKNIGQITKAMQMVSATKMRKSQEVALRARPFAKEALALLSDLVQHEETREQKSIFFVEPKAQKICLIVATSDKGLAGSFNSQILRLASQWMQQTEDVDVVSVGRKGRDYFRRRGIVPVAEFFSFSDIVTLHDAAPLSEWVLSAFEKGRYKRVMVASTQFFSALVQKPDIRQILPLDMEELEDAVKNIIPKTGKYADWKSEEGEAEGHSHLLEPSPEDILQTLVRDLVQVQILHYVFESNASEHSSRMVAMKSATDNAKEVQEELQLQLNKARQASITQELTEISTAKEALSKD